MSASNSAMQPSMGQQPSDPMQPQMPLTSPNAFSASQQATGTAATQMKINKEQEDAVIAMCSGAQLLLQNQFALTESMTNIDRVYMREKDWTEAELRARRANRAGWASKIQNVTVPIVMPQVESSVSYMIETFLTGYPIFGVSSSPDNEQEAMALQAIVSDQQAMAGWAEQMIMFFRDGLKYNLHALEVTWEQKTTFTIANNKDMPNGAQPKQVVWSGNRIKRMDLYNTFFDPRVHPSRIHIDGEYAGYTEIMGRMQFKQFCNDLTGKVSPLTIKRALESASVQGAFIAGARAPYSYNVPLINPNPMTNNSTIGAYDWSAWFAGQPGNATNIKYQNVYNVTYMYVKILPSEFGFDAPAKNTPQIWKFVIINGQVVLYVERQTNAHGWLPIIFGQPLGDGLDYQTKSFAQNVEDMQAVASALWNGYLASKRRLVGDRAIYDPSRVAKADINSDNPAAKIPVRPSAYGKPIQEAVYAFPYRDEQTNSMLEGAAQVTSFADKINGVNAATQGQFTKGNRTLHEYDDIMGHGNAKNHMMALMTEAQVFVPVKEIIKLNILQYQKDGNVVDRQTGQTQPIDMVALRNSALNFKMSDGVLPKDKEMSEDVLQTAIQVMGSSPQIGSQYRMGDLFSYLMEEQGADISSFQKSQEQIQYEQQLNAWQMAAANAAKAGTAFNTPMPQPPQPPPTPQPAGSTQPTSGSAAALPANSLPVGSPTGAPSQQQPTVGGNNSNLPPSRNQPPQLRAPTPNHRPPTGRK